MAGCKKSVAVTYKGFPEGPGLTRKNCLVKPKPKVVLVAVRSHRTVTTCTVPIVYCRYYGYQTPTGAVPMRGVQ